MRVLCVSVCVFADSWGTVIAVPQESASVWVCVRVLGRHAGPSAEV
jgi:hypothetical protein